MLYEQISNHVLLELTSAPFNVVMVLLRTQNELLIDKKVSRTSPFLKTAIVKLYNDIGYKEFCAYFGYNLLSVVILQFFNLFIIKLFKIDQLDSTLSFWVRYSTLTIAMMVKSVLSWICGYFLIVKWISGLTSFKIKSKKHSNSPREQFAVKSNIKLLTLIGFMFMVYNIQFLSTEFLVDTCYYSLIKDLKINHVLKRIMMQFLINFTCELLSWPWKNLMFQLSVGLQCRNLKSFSQILTVLKTHFKWSNLFAGTRLYIPVQLLYLLIRLITTTLNLVNQSRQ